MKVKTRCCKLINGKHDEFCPTRFCLDGLDFPRTTLVDFCIQAEKYLENWRPTFPEPNPIIIYGNPTTQEQNGTTVTADT